MKSFLTCVVILVVFVFVSGMANAQGYQIKSETLNFPSYQLPNKAVDSRVATKKVSVNRLPFQRDYPVTKVKAKQYYCVNYYPAPYQYCGSSVCGYQQPICMTLLGGVCRLPIDLLDSLFGGGY